MSGERRRRTYSSRRTQTLAATLLFFMMALYTSASSAKAADPVTLSSLTLRAYLDGYVQVTHELEVDKSSPSVNITLLGDPQNLLVVDEKQLLLDFSLADILVTVDSLGCSRMTASYFTQDLTSKTGKYWTMKTTVPINTTVMLPEEASIISLNAVPDLIESSENQVTLVMPAGLIEISYVAERSFAEEPAGDSYWLLLGAAALLSVLFVVVAVWFFRRGKTPKPKEAEIGSVDVEKLFEREKDLRQEEVQVIQFLAEKNGSAYEAELYERLALPRTTTWRLLKRLEKMGIVEIRKTRRQNIVSVKKKYMKKPNKEAS